MTKDARFYFANLGADVARCIKAVQSGDEKRYVDSLGRARTTLVYLRQRPEAYEEGTLLLRGLVLARESGEMDRFKALVAGLMMYMAPTLRNS